MPQNKFYTIGIDVGGTKLAGVLFDGQKIIADYVLATPKDGLDHFLVMLNALVEPLLEKAKKDKIKVSGLGLGVPGPLDKDGRLLDLPNLAILNGTRLAEIVEKRLGISAAIDNDANCFVRAEAKLGAGKKYPNFFGLTIGTGIGGGWWHKDEIYEGEHRGAGEPGHIIINCDTGIDLETAYQKLVQGNAAKLAEEAYRGDVLAQKAFEEFGQYLGIVLADIVNLIDPQAIIIGGGVAQVSDLFLPQAKKIMRQYIISAEARKIKLLKSKLGPQAGAIGAALLARQTNRRS